MFFNPVFNEVLLFNLIFWLLLLFKALFQLFNPIPNASVNSSGAHPPPGNHGAFAQMSVPGVGH